MHSSHCLTNHLFVSCCSPRHLHDTRPVESCKKFLIQRPRRVRVELKLWTRKSCWLNERHYDSISIIFSGLNLSLWSNSELTTRRRVIYQRRRQSLISLDWNLKGLSCCHLSHLTVQGLSWHKDKDLTSAVQDAYCSISDSCKYLSLFEVLTEKVIELSL